MSRNLYKLIQDQEERIAKLEIKTKLLENYIDHLETLIRLNNKTNERTTQPLSPWYKEPTLEQPYKITCELENDPFVKLCKEAFKI